MATMHPAIKEELDMLREQFPGMTELTLDEYAVHNRINRRNAARHFNHANEGRYKINHKRFSRKDIRIPMIDYAYYLAQHKVVDGQALVLPGDGDIKEIMKRRRGFNSTPQPQNDYRRLG